MKPVVDHLAQSLWTRRSWLATQTTALAAVAHPALFRANISAPFGPTPRVVTSEDVHAERIDRSAWEALALRAVDAARSAGAEYADARLTRIVTHKYEMHGDEQPQFYSDNENVGLGVRAFVKGYWGFAADSHIDGDTATRIAGEAVRQAFANAKGTPRSADLGRYPVTKGEWTTPVAVDPFSVSIEEKSDAIMSWVLLARQLGLFFETIGAQIQFSRQERVVATTDGSLFSQTFFESGGYLKCGRLSGGGSPSSGWIRGITPAGKGWELMLDANIAEQIRRIPDEIEEETVLQNQSKPATVGRYTVIYDGATMASLVQETFGLATQIDRALGYEANAAGTSFITDPLGSLGQLRVAASPITITANRSAPGQLATVKWDDEGVVPRDCTLIKDGVLADFQTTREQAGWLAPYYQKRGHPVVSNGYAASESALRVPMQHMPNLAMESRGPASVADLIASVPSGIFVTRGDATTDFQMRSGTIRPLAMRKITNGRLGAVLGGGAIVFNTTELWKNISVIGDVSTQGLVVESQYPWGGLGVMKDLKGEPAQGTSHTVTAPAAVVTNQALINPDKRS